jgi:two-component system cell cycle sensor histidine kinase/response regulator CckA
MSAATATSNGPAAEQRPLIFAVDDEPMLLELASMILQPQGFRVETFRDPLAAVRAFSLANPLPALIVTDFAMHRMNGLDLIRDCRVIHPGQKILMVSGTVDESIYRDAPHQPDAFLPKPYSATELTAVVNKLLGR